MNTRAVFLKRISFDLILIIMSFLCFFWIPIIVAVLGLLYFDYFYEAILVGIIIDALYGQFLFFGSFGFVFSLFFILIFYFLSSFRKNLLIKNA